MIGLDTETTGLDLRHGAKPYLVTTASEDEMNLWWEWDVDPMTREPKVPRVAIKAIQKKIDKAESIVLQNPKFDVAALATIGVTDWPWEKTYDTLLAGHLLASNEPHDLTTMVLIYLGYNVQPFEDRIKEATTACRKMCQGKNPEYNWRIATPGLPEMPSARGNPWKYDMWLPRYVAGLEKRPRSDPWFTMCHDYANCDSTTTLALFKVQKKLLKERNLWRIYQERLKILPIVYKMESAGITLNRTRLKELLDQYREESARAGRICTNLASGMGHELTLPKSGNNKSLTEFVFGKRGLALKPFKVSKKTQKPSFDKASLEHYMETLPRRSKAYTFIKGIHGKRKRDTAIAYMESYQKFWVPTGESGNWWRMFPSLNPTGTSTLRWSSQNPNEQNISKQVGFNLRYCFGPMPGREWWSLDAKNIELRIPAYESGETSQIELFEKPDEPPFYGSNHLLVFSILHPKEWAKYGVECKKKYASTLYQWTKNGNFAVQYGAVEESGTADRAYHVEGGQRRIQGRFKKGKLLNDKMIAQAKKQGYVETLPDINVDPQRGYPLQCKRSQWGQIIPTIPLNYHVQGTAMWWMMKAMIRCQGYLNQLNERAGRDNYFMVMQVHDELVFDFPKRKNHGNLPKIRKIQKLMERGGEDIGIPTPCSVEYHETTWSEGEVL